MHKEPAPKTIWKIQTKVHSWEIRKTKNKATEEILQKRAQGLPLIKTFNAAQKLPSADVIIPMYVERPTHYNFLFFHGDELPCLIIHPSVFLTVYSVNVIYYLSARQSSTRTAEVKGLINIIRLIMMAAVKCSQKCGQDAVFTLGQAREKEAGCEPRSPRSSIGGGRRETRSESELYSRVDWLWPNRKAIFAWFAWATPNTA